MRARRQGRLRRRERRRPVRGLGGSAGRCRSGRWNIVNRRNAAGARDRRVRRRAAGGAVLPRRRPGADHRDRLAARTATGARTRRPRPARARSSPRARTGLDLLGLDDARTMHRRRLRPTGTGLIETDVTGNPLPSAYGAAFDGSCVVGLGDPGLVFRVDPSGLLAVLGPAGEPDARPARPALRRRRRRGDVAARVAAGRPRQAS